MDNLHKWWQEENICIHNLSFSGFTQVWWKWKCRQSSYYASQLVSRSPCDRGSHNGKIFKLVEILPWKPCFYDIGLEMIYISLHWVAFCWVSVLEPSLVKYDSLLMFHWIQDLVLKDERTKVWHCVKKFETLKMLKLFQ